ncbi:hypothetical protein [Azospirillum sp. sgz302134]
MPDGRTTPEPTPPEQPVGVDGRTFVAMLEAGLASLAAGNTVDPDELDRMIDDAFAQQDAAILNGC